MNEITYKKIISLMPCYDPIEIGMPESYEATIIEFIKDYRSKVKSKEDILWVLCRNQFLHEKELRLFAVWCARKVQHLMTDERSIKALDVAENYADEKYGAEEIAAAKAAAAAADAARDDAAAWAASRAAAWGCCCCCLGCF